MIAAGCGGKSDAPAPKDDAAAGSAKPAVAALALPTLGVDRPSRMNYLYGDGAAAYAKAVAAYNAKPRDWAAVRANCEAAIAKDPLELDAHWLLATALAQTGDPAAAVDHIVTALAADYDRFGASLTTADLESFRATPHGQAVVALAAKIGDEYAKRVGGGVWVVARRSPFRWPAQPGVQPAATRGELYAYDVETKRYFRLSHTDHQVAAFVRASSGAEVALLGFDRIDRPKSDPKVDKDKAVDAAPPLLARAWVDVVDAKTWKPIGKRVNLPSAREVTLGYGAGDQLVATTAPANGRWDVGAPTVSSVDASSGKLTAIAGDAPAARVTLTVDEGGWADAATDAAAAPTTIALGSAAIAVPESGQAQRATIAIAPDKLHVAFATAVDPCAKDVAPSLYVGDSKGALKHVLTAHSRFTTRWLDAATLAYEDGDGGIRLFDVVAGRERGKLEDKPGMALAVLSPSDAPLCKARPDTAGAGSGSGSAGSGSASDDMPPEGPVTTPP